MMNGFRQIMQSGCLSKRKSPTVGRAAVGTAGGAAGVGGELLAGAVEGDCFFCCSAWARISASSLCFGIQVVPTAAGASGLDFEVIEAMSGRPIG